MDWKRQAFCVCGRPIHPRIAERIITDRAREGFNCTVCGHLTRRSRLQEIATGEPGAPEGSRTEMKGKPKRHAKIRKLRKQQEQIKAEVRELEGDFQRVRAHLKNQQERLRGVQKEIERLISVDEPVRVSDHAVIRYLERRKGLNVKDLKKAILPEETLRTMESLGFADGSYPADGHHVRLQGRVVVTVTSSSGEPVEDEGEISGRGRIPEGSSDDSAL